MSREDQYSVHLTIDGQDCGVWDKLTGGDIDSDESKYHPGNMGEPVSLGGKKTVANVTLSRLFKQGRDTGLLPFLESRVGLGQCVVSKQPLDLNRTAYGSPLVYSGTLKTVNPPDADSESNNAALIAVEISSATVVAT